MSRKLSCLAALCLVVTMTAGAGAQQGKVLFEYWFGGGVDSNLDNLKANANFPDNPAQSEWRDGMDRPDWSGMDYWGARARAYLTPPESGDYTFWIASDDDSELWLSTDANAVNAVEICSVEGWNNYQDWTGTSGSPGPNRQSAPVSLVAGEKYYIEMMFSDGTGGGHGSVGWAGPGVGETPTVLKGNVLTAFIRDPEPLFLATNPNPADGEQDVTSPMFSWTAGLTAAKQNVYMGTDPVLGPNDLKQSQAINMFYNLETLEPGVTYYWRVDMVDAAEAVYEGPVWSFTVMPMTAHFPSPYDGALWRRTDLTASWTPGQTAVSHMIYAGIDEALVAAGDPNVLLATIAESSIDASPILVPGMTYFWRIDEVDEAGTVYPGEVWTFTTFDPAGGAVAEYWDNMALSGDPKVVTTTGEVNFSWPGTVPGVDSPDVNIPVDAFSCRWTAALNVPVTGTYKLYSASDDGARLFLNDEQITSGWVDRGTTEDASADLELVAGQRYVIVMEMYENGGGAAAYLRWSGPDIPKEVIPQGALQFVTWAYSPLPAIGTEGLGDTPTLSWLPGVGAVSHDVYLSSSEAKVAAGDASVRVSQQAETSYVPTALNWNTTYYWKVDEVAADGSVVAGDVWSFKIADYIPVIDEAVTVDYDNTVDPFVTELVVEYADGQNWTKNGVTSLQLQVKGDAPKVSMSNGVVTMQAAGSDIWNNADEFRYVYQTLTGDGSLVARVVSMGTGSNEWAKAGVMIRQSIAAGSAHAFMPITSGGGNGASFQRRLVTDGGSSNNDSGTAVTAPYFVKIERIGNSFTGSISATGDVNDWTQLGDPITIDVADMNDPVLIGLAATSHAAGEMRTFVLDSIAGTGEITGDYAVADIGVAQGGNDAAPVSVTLVDAAGASATVQYPGNPGLTLATDWVDWKILTSEFSGIDRKAITKMVVSIGDGQPDGTGTIQVANVRVVKPVTVNVVNYSFEQPNPTSNLLYPANTGAYFTSIPGWNTDSVARTRISKAAKPTNGSWAALLWGGDPAIWQVTDYTIINGEAFTATVDASVVMGAIRDSKSNLKVSLFYSKDGARVSLGSKSFTMPKGPKSFTVDVSAANARKGAGYKLGIEIANIMDNTIGVDNVRLKTK
ncbi:MAG: PA14 domain-containing protein [Phycisphaerales bacterium]